MWLQYMPRYHLQRLIDRRLKYKELERYQPSWVLLIILASCHIITLQEFQDMTKVRIYSLSLKLWIIQKRLFPSQLDGQYFHSLSFSLTCPNLYHLINIEGTQLRPVSLRLNLLTSCVLQVCQNALFCFCEQK